MTVLFLISPLILTTCSIFSTFPVLKRMNNFFFNFDEINTLFLNAFLCIYVSFRFIYNISVYIAINHKTYLKIFLKFFTFYLYFFELCLTINHVICYFLLIMSGDIETNPGPINEKTSISICHWNLNGVSTQNYVKLSMLEAYNSIYDYDIICLSETFLNSTHSSNDPALKLQGYELIRSDHPSNTKRGGVCMYYKEHLPLKLRNDITYLNECIVVELKSKKHKFFLTSLYRSPSQSDLEFNIFIDDLENILSKISLETPLLSVVLGDFNAKNNKWLSTDINSIPGVELNHLFSLSGFKQLIKEPTNFEPNKRKTCIDLIFSSQQNLISESGVHPSLFQTCHHQIIYAKIDLRFYLPPPYERQVWFYDRAETELINRAISNFDWEHAFSPLDPNEQVELLNLTLLNIFRNFIPHKMIKSNSKDAPWISNEIKTSLRKKARLYKKYLSNGSKEEDFNNLKTYSTYCSDLISSSKKEYFTKLSNKLSDPQLGPKTYWSILNGILGKVKIPAIPPLIVNNTFETNFVIKAKMFNDFFASQCTVIDNNSTLPQMVYKTNNRLNDITIDHDSIVKIIKNLNTAKAHGWDGISIRMIKICEQSISIPLIIIFKKAILSGIYPDNWKKGNIVPVHKKENKSLIKNYRPISLLPICGKIFEKLIYNSLFEFLKLNKLIAKSQSGFLPGDSCVSQLLCITHEIYKSFDCNLETRGLFLDISKAFDRVWHQGLLFKLKSNGIDGPLFYLLSDYLHNRKQRVVLNGQTSDWAEVKAGVPQGSVLGPLLFLVYINDLPDGLKSNAKLFADDTSIFSVVNDANVSYNQLNSDLLQINSWAFQWKMLFNPDPNKSATEVIFSHRREQYPHLSVKFNNSLVVSQASTKHLGMILDSKLDFNFHLNEKIALANKGIGMIKKLQSDLSRKTLINIYKSFVRPHLDYGDIIYDKPNVDSFINKLESVQYNAGLAITGGIRGTSKERLYQELGFEYLEKRRWYRRMCLFWKIINGFAPSYLSKLLPEKQPLRNPNRQDHYVSFSKNTNYYANSFFPYCTDKWNSLDPAIKDIKTLPLFKKALLEFIRPSAAHVFDVIDHSGLKLLTRVRLKLSHLNEHKFRHNFRDTLNPLCSCSLEPETSNHFLLHCPHYDTHRQTLFDYIYTIDESISNLSDDNLVSLLLYGNSKLYCNDQNTNILNATICFLKSSERFDNALY